MCRAWVWKAINKRKILWEKNCEVKLQKKNESIIKG